MKRVAIYAAHCRAVPVSAGQSQTIEGEQHDTYEEKVRASMLPRPATAITVHRDAQLKQLMPFLHDVEPLIEHLRASHVPVDTSTESRGPAKTVLHSWLEVLCPLASDMTLRDMYSDAGTSNDPSMPHKLNRFRMAKLYELIDSMTADVAYRHTDGLDPARPLALVTAGHYDAKWLHPIDICQDLAVRSYVVGVGTSSLEIRTDALQAAKDGREYLVHFCHTVMVATEKFSGKVVAVPPLSLEGVNDLGGGGKQRADIVEQNRRERKNRQAMNMSLRGKSVPPSPDEMDKVHQLFLEAVRIEESGLDEEKGQWMSKWTFTNSLMIYPEQKNLHGKLFGGFVAQAAYELASFTATAFCGDDPLPLGFDQMLFHQPLAIGDLVLFTSRVVYTEGRAMRIWVEVEVLDRQQVFNQGIRRRWVSGKRTNNLEFVFAQAHGSPAPLRKIQPQTYPEVMMYLDARRWQQEQGPTEDQIKTFESSFGGHVAIEDMS